MMRMESNENNAVGRGDNIAQSLRKIIWQSPVKLPHLWPSNSTLLPRSTGQHGKLIEAIL